MCFENWLSNGTERDINLYFKFFAVFSRFEYALKKAGFVGGDDKKLWVNWNEFAKKYAKKFNEAVSETQNVKKAVDFFKNAPPRKQILKGKTDLDWAHSQKDLKIRRGDKEPSLQWLTEMVRRVRNNLFHGGKKMIESRERDRKLIENSLTLICCWLDMDERVKDYFWNLL